MNKMYYEAIDKMEKSGVNKEYIVGWASGFLHNPRIEEQRDTEAYSAGYKDGTDGKTDNFGNWLASS